MDFSDLSADGLPPKTNTFILGNPVGPGGSIELEEAAGVSAPEIMAAVLEALRQHAASQGLIGKVVVTYFSAEPMAKAVLIAAAGHIALLEGRISALHQCANEQEARIQALEERVEKGMSMLEGALA